MALGHRSQEQQPSFWIAVDELPRSEGHVFYRKLNKLLREAGFDEFVERLCEPYYHDTLGRPGIPPGVYFRMLAGGLLRGPRLAAGHRLAYKAEHVVDLDTELILAAEIYPADAADVDTIGPSISQAQDNLIQAESDAELEEAVADKGYSGNETLADWEFTEGLRTYISEPQHTHRRNWKDKPEEQRQAVTNNRRRTRAKRGRALQRQRSEKVERSFAHVCETGGSRRTGLHGLEKVKKRYLTSAMARNPGLVLRHLFGIGTARSLQGEGGLADDLYVALFNTLAALERLPTPTTRTNQQQPTAHHPLALAA